MAFPFAVSRHGPRLLRECSQSTSSSHPRRAGSRSRARPACRARAGRRRRGSGSRRPRAGSSRRRADRRSTAAARARRAGARADPASSRDCARRAAGGTRRSASGARATRPRRAARDPRRLPRGRGSRARSARGRPRSARRDRSACRPSMGIPTRISATITCASGRIARVHHRSRRRSCNENRTRPMPRASERNLRALSSRDARPATGNRPCA